MARKGTNYVIFYGAILFFILPTTNAISIKPADFDRLIMPCYLGGSSSSMYGGYSQQVPSLAQNTVPSGVPLTGSGLGGSYSNQQVRSSANTGQNNLASGLSSSGQNTGAYQPTYYAAADNGRQARDGFSNLGQQVPRANTIDNFIALVSKIEASNPRLANNPDQLIKTLLGRFRMDNYYYDVRSRTPIGEQDHRNDIIPAILNTMGFGQQQMQPQSYLLSSDVFPEQLLDHDEKCSMYFMLSHFIDKGTSTSQPLASTPISQLSGPQGGQRPPVLQAAGSGYPAQSANSAYSGGSSGPRYPGPSPSFGSPATSNMNSFSNGLSNTPDYNSNNPYGMNNVQPNNQYNLNYNNLRNTGQYSGTISSNVRNSIPLIDGNARFRDDRAAIEYGVVTVANQENAALVLNRVLMGILAASTPPQTLRQLSSMIYPTQQISSTSKFDEEIDPLYAVTLADLWAISSIPKAGKPFDIKMLGDNGRWNSTMCPTSFQLERANSIRFTTAELLGGLDGFNLGMFRRRLIDLRKNIRLSELLRMYYSRGGFRPQFAEIGVCNRQSGLNTQLDDLHRQAEAYLRLYQLNLPPSDSEIAMSINRLDSFKEVARQAASQYAPSEICQESSYNEPYSVNPQDQCEIAKADVVTLLDTSPQANDAFMNLVVTKLAMKLGLSRQGNSLSVLTNQQDTTGYAGAYSFNAVVRNSTNTGEIGCALVHDTTRSFQGGQITDPTRLVEMLERALVNLDSEYLVRQNMNGMSSSSYRPSTYVSSLFGQSENSYYVAGGGPKNTGGAKIIIWFNFGSQTKPALASSGPTNWNTPLYSQGDNNQYKFHEAKRFLRENFRGASILVATTNRDEAKSFVYDEDRDIFTDMPPGNGGSSMAIDYYPSADPSTMAALSGPADQLVNKLLQRMCDIPAVFQYPMCFRAPSDNTVSQGYITPGKRQYWMMSPKTFFASRTVRMAFKVDGGRIKVCFGRMSKPDESAMRNGQDFAGSISLGSGSSSKNPGGIISTASSAFNNDGNNFYTGLKSGICKDVSPGQEIDFIVDDPCYKKPIAECEPFYFVIRETSNIGEGDPNYMCKDEGCKRLDQVKFTLSHTGVSCSSAFRLKASWVFILTSVIIGIAATNERRPSTRKHSTYIAAILSASFYFIVQQVHAQQAGVNDFGQGRYGEKRGDLTPYGVIGILLLVMVILAGLALTIGFCYYVSRRNPRGMTRVEQDEY